MYLRELIEQILLGLMNGSIYVLLGTGIALIFGVMRLINVAHGEFLTLGAFIAITLGVVLDLPFYVYLPITVVLTFSLGLICDRILFQPLRASGRWQPQLALILTLALSIVLANGMQMIWGSGYRRGPSMVEGSLGVGEVFISASRVLAAGVSVVTMTLLFVFFKYARWGKALRAVSQNEMAARVIGISRDKAYAVAFATSTALAGIAGILLSSVYYIFPAFGFPFLIKAFIITILGGLGSVGGAVLGGFLLGILESLGVVWLGGAWQNIVGPVTLLIVLFLRPEGLFGFSTRRI